jgi:hypothetical protein
MQSVWGLRISIGPPAALAGTTVGLALLTNKSVCPAIPVQGCLPLLQRHPGLVCSLARHHGGLQRQLRVSAADLPQGTAHCAWHACLQELACQHVAGTSTQPLA